MAAIVMATVLVCLVTAAVGALALHLVRGRSLVWSVVVAALIPLVAVSASILLNVQLMFISTHDSTAVSVALACASVIGVLLSLVLGRRVAQGSRSLTRALRDLGRANRDEASPQSSGRPSGAPGEIASLATELEMTRLRLDEAQRRATALEDSRRELVAFMSHDLRTPLAGLRALAEGLEDGVIQNRPAALRQMRQTVDRMTGLVGDLFELSRVNAARSSQSRTRSMVSLVELVHDVTAELDAHARRRGVTVRVEVEPGDDRLAVVGIADDLARALTNLLGNAVRHTAPGREVVVSADRGEDGRIHVSVTDGCGGIPDGDLERVFDVGWRAAPERSSTDAGAGLGLAIARGVIESHEGSIDIQNVPGGCRFGVTLPQQPVSDSA